MKSIWSLFCVPRFVLSTFCSPPGSSCPIKGRSLQEPARARAATLLAPLPLDGLWLTPRSCPLTADQRLSFLFLPSPHNLL
jgi:hypothetical protein